MKTLPQSTESNQDSTSSEENTTGYDAENSNNEENSEDANTDEFGYDVEENEDQSSDDSTDNTEETTPDDNQDDSENDEKETLPGYDDQEESDEDEESSEPAEEENAEGDDETLKAEDITKLLGDLPNKDKITQFALDNKMNKAQIEAYAKLAKEENESFESERKRLIKEQRKNWKKSLAEDPEFGGENYDRNVHKAAKVLNNYMSNTKKVLTDKGSMLPPSIMKDLAKLYDTLNPTTTFENKGNFTKENDIDDLDQMYE